MTAACGGAASSPKPGVSTTVLVDSTYARNLFPVALQWLYPYLPFMQAIAIGDTVAFCAAEPPIFTVPSAVDLYNFLTGSPITQASTVTDFLTNVVKAYLWTNLCQCGATGVSPSPATPVQPIGSPDVNNVPALTNAPCKTVSKTGTVGTGGGWINNPVNVVAGLPTPTVYRVTINGLQTSGNLKTQFRIRQYSPSPGSPPAVTDVLLTVGSTSTPAVMQVPISPLADSWQVTGVPDPSFPTGFTNYTVLEETWCGGQSPGSIVAPCCPPDPSLVLQVQQILDYVKLLQRQLAPFAYVSGTVHAGLSGAGSFPIQGLLGVRIQVTSFPVGTGYIGSTPVDYFDLGYVTFGTPDGWPTAIRVQRAAQVALPPRCSAYTVVDFDLSPGTVVTITELLREP